MARRWSDEHNSNISAQLFVSCQTELRYAATRLSWVCCQTELGTARLSWVCCQTELGLLPDSVVELSSESLVVDGAEEKGDEHIAFREF